MCVELLLGRLLDAERPTAHIFSPEVGPSP
jgi:hypothetical protein